MVYPILNNTSYDIEKWKSFSDGIQSREDIIDVFLKNCLDAIKSHTVETRKEIISCRISQNEKVILDEIVKVFYMKTLR